MTTLSNTPTVAIPNTGEREEIRPLPLSQLSLLALALGIITGLGAVLFRDLIGLIHNLAFSGRASLHYDANVFTAPST
jgi:CIC family chloride channel protein